MQRQLGSISDMQATAALLHIALADAQGITTLRAMAKNNAPSLIASLALDTANLYKSAASSAKSAPFTRKGPKALQYADYKAAVYQAYACCFTGIFNNSPQHLSSVIVEKLL